MFSYDQFHLKEKVKICFTPFFTPLKELFQKLLGYEKNKKLLREITFISEY